MTGIVHTRVVTLAESLDPSIEVDYGEWNADHNITGVIDFGVYSHKFDNIVESTLNAGVTIGGVLLKNNVIPDSAYPNAILDDGTRAMTGNFTLEDGHKIVFERVASPDTYIERYGYSGLRLIRSDAGGVDLICRNLVPSGVLFFLSNAYVVGAYSAASHYYLKTHDGSIVQTAADLYGGFMDISRAGDITMLDDKMIDLGNETTGAAANAANRGKLRFVEGAGGARDRVYSCMKSDADAYSWVEIVNGGA